MRAPYPTRLRPPRPGLRRRRTGDRDQALRIVPRRPAGEDRHLRVCRRQEHARVCDPPQAGHANVSELAKASKTSRVKSKAESFMARRLSGAACFCRTAVARRNGQRRGASLFRPCDAVHQIDVAIAAVDLHHPFRFHLGDRQGGYEVQRSGGGAAPCCPAPWRHRSPLAAPGTRCAPGPHGCHQVL